MSDLASVEARRQRVMQHMASCPRCGAYGVTDWMLTQLVLEKCPVGKRMLAELLEAAIRYKQIRDFTAP